MNNETARVIGGCFIALCDAIKTGRVEDAQEKLASWSLNPDLPAEDRRVYSCIAHSASLTPEEAAAENAELDRLASRPSFRVIAGGAA
jgi:hypothetical protein